MKITEASHLRPPQEIEEVLGTKAVELIKGLRDFDKTRQNAKPLRLGIMGGTFDPIHWGHLVTAEFAQESYELDLVLFLVTGDPATKRHRLVSDACHRCAMVELAIEGNPLFELSLLEVSRKGPSHTIDSLNEIASYLESQDCVLGQDIELYFITGADAVLDIISWKDPQEICSLAHIISACRPGYELEDLAPSLSAAHLRCTVETLEIPALAISSSYLRSRVYSAKTVSYLTDKLVVDYIKEQLLYTQKECL